MALSSYRYPPNTIFLGGQRTEVNDLVAGEAITPGHLVERYNVSGTPKFRKHSTASGMAVPTVATDQHMLNKGVDDAYAAGDLVEASVGQRGSTWWMIVPSGQNLVSGDFLESAGDGTIRKYTSGVRLFQALENKDNSTGPSTARIRVEVV